MTPAALVAVRMRAKVEMARNNKLRQEDQEDASAGQQRLQGNR